MKVRFIKENFYMLGLNITQKIAIKLVDHIMEKGETVYDIICNYFKAIMAVSVPLFAVAMIIIPLWHINMLDVLGICALLEVEVIDRLYTIVNKKMLKELIVLAVSRVSIMAVFVIWICPLIFRYPSLGVVIATVAYSSILLISKDLHGLIENRVK